jgi:large repetitive protein
MRRLRSLPFFLVAALALVLIPGAGATAVDPAVLPSGTTDSAYNQTLTCSGGVLPCSFAVSAGALPPGLALNAAGDLTGTPTSSGNFSFTVTAVDSAGPPVPGSRAYVLSISPATVTITPTTLYPAQRGIFYEDFFDASGGTGPYTFAVTSGALPAGVTVASDGYLSGIPAAAGSYTFTVRVTDAHSSTGFRTFTLDVNLETLNITPPTLTDGTPGVAYATQLSGAGGTTPYTFSVASGTSLPPGLALSANGALTGTPSQGGTYSVAVTITDATAQTMTRTYVFRVPLVPLTVTATLPTAGYGVAYDQFFGSSGGTVPYRYSLAGGALPAGLTLANTGELYGTPTTFGTFSFSITSVDKYGDTGTFFFTLVVAPPQIVMIPDILYAATSGLFYSAKMTASGGVGTYTYTLASGTLPPGLTLAADGTISGIPNAAPALFAFTVKATDSNLATGTKAMTLKLETPVILVDSVALPIATIGVTYLQTLSVSGGTAAYSYSLVDGTLPAGLVLSTTGILSGSPATPGTSTFTVLIVDANGVKGTQSFRVVVVKSTPTVVKKPPKKVVATHPKKKKAKAKKH